MHDDGLDANKRVICGYSEGRGHPGDKYKKTIVLAKNWKNAKNDNALWGHNTKKVAKALKWFFHDVGPGNASAKQAYFIQTYVWAKTMGRNSDTALEQLARSKNWTLSDCIKWKTKWKHRLLMDGLLFMKKLVRALPVILKTFTSLTSDGLA